MAGTLLSIIQEVAEEAGLATPSTVIASTADDVKRLLRFSNQTGRMLVKAGDGQGWPQLQRLHSFTTTASTDEYALPSDFDRLVIETSWDRTSGLAMPGPITIQQWEEVKSSGIGSTVMGRRWRIMRSSSGTGTKFTVDPVPSTTGDTLVFRYVSANWCVDTTEATARSAWAVDTDIFLLDRDLMVLGTLWRFQKWIGDEYGDSLERFERHMGMMLGQSNPAPVIDLARGSGNFRLLDGRNYPETGLTGPS